MKIHHQRPNFSIKLPGRCNANCTFCFLKCDHSAKPTPLSKKDWEHKLVETIQALPEPFHDVSITGAEPTMSPYLFNALNAIEDSGRDFNHIVLNTNGYKALEHIERISEVCNCMTISRHGPHWFDNMLIFDTMSIPKDDEVKEIIDRFFGEVHINCVVLEQPPLTPYVDEMIEYVKLMGADELVFRMPCERLKVPDLPYIAWKHEREAKGSFEYTDEAEHSISFMRNDLRVTWRAMINEPAYAMSRIKEDKYLYELIYHANGKVYEGWTTPSWREVDLSGEFIPHTTHWPA
jgi:organic radical activating enzyme